MTDPSLAQFLEELGLRPKHIENTKTTPPV